MTKEENMDFTNFQEKLDELKTKLNEAQEIFDDLQNIAKTVVIDQGKWEDKDN
jgi:uncharacterized protein YgfB (UPF0149 family)